MTDRLLTEKILAQCFKNKLICLFGPRHSGKSHLLKSLTQWREEPFLWLNCNDLATRELFSDLVLSQMENIIGECRLVFIDEAQRIENTSQVFESITNRFPDVQWIVSASSAITGLDKINFPVSGGMLEFRLSPFSFSELVNSIGLTDETLLLEQRMIYGLYPEVIANRGEEADVLNQIIDDVLYKDLFANEKIKKPGVLLKLLKALALQLGNIVSYNEIARNIGIDKETIERYIEILEKAFVVFRLDSFSRSIRTELRKSRKFYFYDNGIRNALLSSFHPIGQRKDDDVLWENYLLSERLKLNQFNNACYASYFWRTLQRQEIHYIEETGEELKPFLFQWDKKVRNAVPKIFSNTYSCREASIITPDNYFSFLGINEYSKQNENNIYNSINKTKIINYSSTLEFEED